MEQVAAECPACGEHGSHQVLKQNGTMTLKCGSCGHVHKKTTEKPRTVERRVVVSQGEESWSTHVPMPATQTLGVGEEFVLDTDEGVYGVEVTALEVEKEGDNIRPETAGAEEVSTVWTRAVDNVTVPLTLHTGRGEAESHELRVPGDYRFVVGETETQDGEEFRVTAFVTRDGDRFRVDGDDVQAKNAKRVYGERTT